MNNMRFSTVILSLVLAGLTVVSLILIKVVYSGAEQAIEHNIELIYQRDQRALNSLMAAQFNNIQQISQELSKSIAMNQELGVNDTSHYGHIIDAVLADISGQHIDAIVVEKKDGSSNVFSNVSLLGIQLPLKQIIRQHSSFAVWTSTLTEVEGKHYSLVHFSLPMIGEQFGEVIGKLHTFVLLNDNFWIANQLQQLFATQAISLRSGNIILDDLESQPGQLQILRSAADNTGEGVVSIGNSTLRTHYLRIGNSDKYMVSSLLSNSAQQLLQDGYTKNLYYATALVIILGSAVMLVIRYLITSALQQVTAYAEQVPPNGSPSPFMAGRFYEFIRVGKAVEQMLLRIRERDKHLSSIIDNSPDLIFIRDLQHNFQLFNQRFSELLNMKQERLRGKQKSGALAADLAAQLREGDLQVLYSHRPIQYEMEIETNNGRSTFLVSKFPIMDDQDKLCSIGAIATDITEIKQAEEQLKLAQQVFSETAEAIIVLDNEQKVLSVNRAFIDMSGFDKCDITTAIQAFLSLHPEILQHLQDAPRWQGEGSLPCSDGSSLAVLVSVTHLSSDSGAKRYVILFSDITELKMAEKRIEKERIMLRATADMSADLIFFKDLESRFLGCNKEFEKFVGCSEQEILVKTDEQLFELKQALMCQEQDRLVMANNKSYCREVHLTSHKGDRHFWEMKKAPLRDKHGQVQGLIGVGRDITEHHLVQKRLKIADTAFENAKENLLVCDGKGNIISANKACCDASGFAKTELLGAHISLIACNQGENIETALQSNHSWNGDISYRTKSGEIHYGWLEVYVVEHPEEHSVSRIYNFIDLNQNTVVEEKIQFLAKHDPLTGLFNRIALFNQLESAIARATHKEATMAVILIDINGFKVINEQFGHNAGDCVLQEVAGRLKSCVFEKDTVARFGDDEFVIIIDELANEQDVAIVAKKVAKQFNNSFTVTGCEVNLSATIGISLWPDDGMDVDTLLGNAEKAMLHGKGADYHHDDCESLADSLEKNRRRKTAYDGTSYYFYTRKLTHYDRQQAKLEEELKLALQQNQFELYYQPQYDLNKLQPVAMEGVLLWHHPQQGVLYPECFLSLAESSGLLADIGLQMLRQAAIQAVIWQNTGIKFGRIAIKVLPVQLAQARFIADLQTILFETKCSSQYLEFQIDEAVFESLCPTVCDNILHISKLGIAFTLDNFAEQRAFLQLFEQLKIEKLKIPQHYIEEGHYHPAAQGVQEAIFALARALGLDVVAESLGNRAAQSANNSSALKNKAMKGSEATFYLRCHKRK